MTKDVIISVEGKQIVDGEEDVNETIAQGTYYYRGGKHYIIYDTYDDDSKIENMIKFNEDIVEVSRKGEITGKLIYEAGKKKRSLYTTPVGDMLMELDTHDINIDCQDEKIEAQIFYEIYVEGDKVSDNEVKIIVKEKK